MSSVKRSSLQSRAQNAPHRREHAATAQRGAGALPRTDILWREGLAMAAAGAVLGPLLDGTHSAHNVLHYANPTTLHIPLLDWQLETCWWVPPLFGTAAILIATGYHLLDWVFTPGAGGSSVRAATAAAPPPLRPPPRGWPAVLACIALFASQYWLSGALEEPLLGRTLPGGVPALDALLLGTALALWAGLDRTRAGLAMSLVTAAAGPLVEILLINGLHLYSYTHPQVWGIPTWIAWVYLAGGPAVGGLARRVAADLAAAAVGTPRARGLRQ